MPAQRIALLLAALFVLFVPLQVSAQTTNPKPTAVDVIVPDPDNLQYMSFWIAKGAGCFRDEGLDLRLHIPENPHLAPEMLVEGVADVALLPPPMYIELIAQETPVLLFANLLQHDSINLVVRRSVAEERKLSDKLPIAERLKKLAGLRIGVAPNPPPRLRALFAAYGMDADKDIEMVIIRGRQQNAAFADRKVDALYCHTPYLERALVDQDAVIIVHQSQGEVAALADRQIHGLVVYKRYAERHPDVINAMTRAIYHAQQLIHADRKRAVDAILHEFPNEQRRHAEKIVTIYEPAIPATPAVSAEGIETAVKLFPARRELPDLSGIDLHAYVAPQFAEAAVKTKPGN